MCILFLLHFNKHQVANIKQLFKNILECLSYNQSVFLWDALNGLLSRIINFINRNFEHIQDTKEFFPFFFTYFIYCSIYKVIADMQMINGAAPIMPEASHEVYVMEPLRSWIRHYHHASLQTSLMRSATGSRESVFKIHLKCLTE